MIVETLDEIVAYLKSAATTVGILQVDSCETEQIHSPNGALVEFVQHSRDGLTYSVTVGSDTCHKTLRLADLIKSRLEYRYRWVKSESFSSKKGCDTCDKVRITISQPVSASPPVYEPEVLLPQIFDVNLSVGFCPPPLPVQVDPPDLSQVVQVKAIDCCQQGSEEGFPLETVVVTFTSADLRGGKYVATVPPGNFFIRDDQGSIVIPDSVKKVGADLYSIALGSRLPLIGTWSITRI